MHIQNLSILPVNHKAPEPLPYTAQGQFTVDRQKAAAFFRDRMIVADVEDGQTLLVFTGNDSKGARNEGLTRLRWLQKYNTDLSGKGTPALPDDLTSAYAAREALPRRGEGKRGRGRHHGLHCLSCRDEAATESLLAVLENTLGVTPQRLEVTAETLPDIAASLNKRHPGRKHGRG